MVSVHTALIWMFFASASASALIPLRPTPIRRLIPLHEFKPTKTVVKRTDPTFPSTPASCPLCQKDFPSISNCEGAIPVLANFSSIIFNPGPFVDALQCSCTDTFKSAFPQCVDCFQQTNQTDVITSDESILPSALEGIRNLCDIVSVIIGNVTDTNGAQASASANSGTAVASPSLSLLAPLAFTIMAIAIGLTVT